MTYIKLDGDVIDLSGLNEVERAYFDECYEAYKRNEEWAAFMNRVRTVQNPLLRATGGRITPDVYNHPLFQAIRDLEDRLGVKQGTILANEGDRPDREPLDDEWITPAQATKLKGVSRSGLQYAIEKGIVITRPAQNIGGKRGRGDRIEVSLASLNRWTVNKTRQMAGKRARQVESRV